MIVGSEATHGRRLVARLVDMVVLAPAFVTVLLTLWLFAAGSFARGLASGLGGPVEEGPLIPVWWWLVMGLAMAVLVVYEPVMVALWGATVGKLTVGIRVVRFPDGAGLGFFRSVVRVMLPTVAGVLSLGVGWFAAMFVLALSSAKDQDERGWHDKIAGTVVVTKSAVPVLRPTPPAA